MLSQNRLWEAKEWEEFAKKLVQLRHGATNVQTVPDKVDGDAGLEFFTTDGCLYQCYAPENVFDIPKCSSAMKQKATNDLLKLKTYEKTISGLVSPLKFNRWILLCPFLDDKDVIRHIAKKIVDYDCKSLSFSDAVFSGLAHSLADFHAEVELLRGRNQGLPLVIKTPSTEEVSREALNLEDRVDEKLQRGFPHDTPAARENRRGGLIRSNLTRSNLVEQLKLEYPDIWETWFQTVNSEETRLYMLGPSSGDAAIALTNELDRLYDKLRDALNTLDPLVITNLTNGQIGAWLLECPLDFQ